MSRRFFRCAEHGSTSGEGYSASRPLLQRAHRQRLSSQPTL